MVYCERRDATRPLRALLVLPMIAVAHVSKIAELQIINLFSICSAMLTIDVIKFMYWQADDKIEDMKDIN